jgi:uncharacterized protein YqhQ
LKKCTIGGQAVLEGVMMKSPDAIAIAVRTTSGEIALDRQPYTPASKRKKIYGLPFVRGVVSFIEALSMGFATLTKAADMGGYEDEEQQPSKFDEFVAKKTGKTSEQVMMFFAVILAVAMAVGLFILLPTFLSGLLRRHIGSGLGMNLIEGGIRLGIFIAYIVLISLMKDIRRVFMYHGAEHKTIACYENEDELTVENARKHSRLHPRCGTSFMLFVVVISILLFTLFGWSENWLIRVVLRLMLMPVVAAISYELLRLSGKYDNIFTRIMSAPGMALQRLTAKEPDDSMLEVAIASFNAALMSTEEYEQAQSEKAQKSNADINQSETVAESEASFAGA